MRYINLDNIDYKGFDVSPDIINLDKANYENRNTNFFLYNGDFSSLPSAELLICKDVLQHLSNQKVRDFLEILPKYKYSLIGNSTSPNPALDNEGDIKDGGFRYLDLTKEPFNINASCVLQLERTKNNIVKIFLVKQIPNSFSNIEKHRCE